MTTALLAISIVILVFIVILLVRIFTQLKNPVPAGQRNIQELPASEAARILDTNEADMSLKDSEEEPETGDIFENQHINPEDI